MNIVAIHEMNNDPKFCFISWRKKATWMWILWLSMKWIMNQNFALFHEEKRPLKCENFGYPWKIINQIFAEFYEENKPFECEYCGFTFSQKEL